MVEQETAVSVAAGRLRPADRGRVPFGVERDLRSGNRGAPVRCDDAARDRRAGPERDVDAALLFRVDVAARFQIVGMVDDDGDLPLRQPIEVEYPVRALR